MARVLVVDDDADMLAMLKARLESWGHDVMATSSGATAGQAIAERGKPDFAVVDVQMPGLTGFDLVRSLRTRPEMREVPIIFLSGLTEPADVAKGKAFGAQYLKKPFNASELSAAIERTRMRGF